MKKICIRCKLEKPIEGFYICKSNNDCLMSHCKECHKIATRKNQEKYKYRRRSLTIEIKELERKNQEDSMNGFYKLISEEKKRRLL